MTTGVDEAGPDVLETLAQLPNDDVFTRPKVVVAVLDTLPVETWSEPDWKWLNPATKSGGFLREIYRRLMDGLTDWEPDPTARREHILRNMIYGSAIARINGEISRRTLYQTSDAVTRV